LPAARYAHLLVTMDAQRREIADGGLFARDGVIEAVGPTAELPPGRQVIDARDQVVLPGLVNTHHHMYQTLTRAVAQDNELFGWLRTLYPLWARLTPEMLHTSTQLALAELLLSGCTTSSDHLYLFPNGCRLDDTLRRRARGGHALPRRARRHERGARARAACRPTRWWKTRPPSCATRSG
jgi:8-oxoguanine deaminase